MNEFETLLSCHKALVKEECKRLANYINHRGNIHDDDKLIDPKIKKPYDLYFADLKKIEFGTDEYYEFEKKHLSAAQAIHAENRHHYYNELNNITDIDLIDLIEAIIDIRQSQIQYNSFDADKLLASLYKCKAMDLKLEDLVVNTIKKLDELDS